MAETDENSTAGEATGVTVDGSAQNEPTVDADGDVPDGTVEAAPRGAVGRPGWVWVQSNSNGRRFDVREDRLQHYSNVTRVEGVPVHYGEHARQPKRRLDLASLTQATKEQVSARSGQAEKPQRASSRRGGGQ